MFAAITGRQTIPTERRGDVGICVQGRARHIGQSYTIYETKLYMLRGTNGRPFHAEFSEQALPEKFLPLSLSVVTKGNYLFLFGIDADAEHLRPIAVRFDVRKNACLDLKPPPYTASWKITSALLNNSVYIMGGQHITRNSQNHYNIGNISVSASQYSIETNSWSKVKNLPKPLHSHSAASHGNYVFCAGGYSGDSNTVPVDKLFAYDVVGKIWLSKASMIHERAKFSLEAVGAKLVACGGEDLPNVEIYDIADNQWILIHNEVLRNHVFPATIVKYSKVYVIGGEDGTSMCTGHVTIVNAEKGTIRRKSSLPFPIANPVCALLTVPKTAAPAQRSHVTINSLNF